MDGHKMAKVVLKQDHVTFSSSNEIGEICHPLNKLNITSFNYVRTYDDGTQVNLSNVPEWLDHFYKNEFYRIGAFEDHPSNYQSGYSLWPQLSGQKIFSDAREHFDIDHGITIIERYKKYCDFYYFGTRANNQGIINFYLNNLDLLKRFTFYFKDSAEGIIRKAEKEKIYIPNHFTEYEKEEGLVYDSENQLRNDFLSNIPIKNIRLTGRYEGEVISDKQAGWIIYYIEGKTAKEIAKLLGLSHRTVEGNIERLKIRLNCKSRSELVNCLIKNGFGIYSQKCSVLV